jgi:hypothetical protein
MTQQCISFSTVDKHRLVLISHNYTNTNNVLFVVYLPRLHQLKLYSIEYSGDLWFGQLTEESGRRLTEDTNRKYAPRFLPWDKAVEA